MARYVDEVRRQVADDSEVSVAVQDYAEAETKTNKPKKGRIIPMAATKKAAKKAAVKKPAAKKTAVKKVAKKAVKTVAKKAAKKAAK
jgi:hypothetical protein